MAWGIYATALLAAYLLQRAVVGTFGFESLDLFLTIALLACVVAPVAEARLAAALAGLAQDLGSIDPFGIHIVSLGLAGLVATRVRDFVNVRTWPGRLMTCLLAGWTANLLYLLHHRFWSGLSDLSLLGIVAASFGTALIASLLTVLLTSLPEVRHRMRRSRRAS